MAKTDLETCLQSALENVENDRALALTLLTDLMQYINKEEARHREVGLTAAKYLETLQRSNEQLVKIASLVHKKENSTFDSSISDAEREDLFDMISESSEDES